MRNFKKFLTLVLAVMMVVSSFAFSTSAATTKFEDVDAKNERLVEAVDLLAYVGVTKGVSETKFGADELVTREQFALFMYRLLKGGKDAPANAANTTNFKDLEDKTYFYAISWANGTGIVNGKSETTYGPKDPITLQEAYTMVVRALDYEKEETLVYPYGYIEVAEQLGVELDKGLDSKLNYDDELTRADMAIILYNAFFAETGVAVVETRERGIGPVVYEDVVADFDVDGDGDVDDDDVITQAVIDPETGKLVRSDYVLEEYVTYPRLCEKAFDVYELDYTVKATPNFRYGTDVDATYDLGYEAAYLELNTADLSDEVAKTAPYAVYLEPAQLGVAEGSLNDYFLGVFKTFVTLTDDDEPEIDKVLFADCDMVKKTTTEIKLGEVSTNKAASYYVDALQDVDDEGNALRGNKLLSGKLTVGDEDIYVFNAPYVYAKNSYASASTAYDKYVTRNEDNIKGIGFYYEEDNDGEIVYYTAYGYELVTPVYANAAGTDVADDYFTQQAYDLIGEFGLAYSEGLYEADLWDVDGDGLYDRINFKPYMFFQVDSDEDKDFDDSKYYDFYVNYATAEDAVPYIYTNGATVLGAEFADEDYVIGYFDPYTRTVKVAEVIKPTVATIKNFKERTGDIVLAGGEKVNATSAYKLLYNMHPYAFDGSYAQYTPVFDAEAQVEFEVANNDLFNDQYIGDEVELYIYNGVVLFDKGVDMNLKFTENLVIPTTLEGQKPVRMQFNAETGDDTYYVYAWIDGETRYIPVDHEDVEPELIDTNAIEFANDLYEDRLCTYVYADGLYTIKSLGEDLDDEDLTYVGVEKDDETVLDDDDADNQFYVIEDAGLAMDKKAGTRFELVGAANFDRFVDLKSYTKVVVRTWDFDDKNGDGTQDAGEEDVYEYVELAAADFTDDMENAFDYAEFVVSNNPDSVKRENLVVMYAEIAADDFALVADTNRRDYRILSNREKVDDENGDWRYEYDAYNPFTGKKEVVPGKATATKASALDAKITEYEEGALVKLADGFVDDRNGKTPIVNNVVDDAQLLWIAEYDEADDYIVVVPVEEADAIIANNNGDENCKKCLKEAIESYEGGFEAIDYAANSAYGSSENFIDINDNTVITVIKNSSFDALFDYSTFELADASVLADPAKEYLCYNSKKVDSFNNFKTGYADYLKAYVAVDATVEPGENPVAEFIMIVVTDGEPSGRDDLDCTANADHN